jgi:hypothetical protein
VVSPLRSRRMLFAGLVVLVMAGMYGFAGLRHPIPAADSASGRVERAPVTSTIRACAAPGSSGVTAGALAMVAVPGPVPGRPASGAAQGGTAVITRMVPGGSAASGPAVATITRPGLTAVTPVRTAVPLPTKLLTGQSGSSPKVSTQAARGGIQVTATGAMAQGLAVEQTGRGGTPTAQCASPGTSFWFAGPGQARAAHIELFLMNTDSQAADVQVTAITDATKGGPILGNADNGIAVPPHSMVAQSLGHLLRSSKVVALNVSTSVGRVVAAVRETRNPADVGGWLPPTSAPARSIVIPGLPASTGSRDLYIAVPGNATAQVRVTAVTTRGSYHPTGGTGIDLLGGSATEIPLSSLGGVAGAVRISASAPVVASVLVPGGPAGVPGAVAASSGPIQEQGVLAANPGASASLVLSAPSTAASVRVVVAGAGVPANGQAGTVVTVKARSSVVLPVRAPGRHRGGLVLIVVSPLPRSGPVFAGRVITSGGVVQTIMPVPSSLTWIPEPPVHSSLADLLP